MSRHLRQRKQFAHERAIRSRRATSTQFVGLGMERSPDHFEVVEGRGFFRPMGSMSLEAAAELITVALAHARARGIKELLVNATGLTGFEPPSLSERYFIVENWARVARGAVRVAMVLRPEYIDPQKFGVTVAFNRRLIADVFELEAPALAWLGSRDPPFHVCMIVEDSIG